MSAEAEEEIHNLLWQLSRTLNEPEFPGLRQYSIITDILHVLFVQCKHENTNAVSDEEQARSRHVKLVKEYLQQHFREEITEMEVAKMLGLSPIYLSTLFSKTVGMQFREYLLKIRLEHAMDALLISEQANLYRKMQAGISNYTVSAFETGSGGEK